MNEIVASITDAISLSKQLAGLFSAIKDVKAKNIIADLNIKLASINIQVAELIEENTRLQEELAFEREIRGKVVFKDRFYYLDDDGPFCTACYDSRRKLIRVAKMLSQSSQMGITRWICPVCQVIYE